MQVLRTGDLQDIKRRAFYGKLVLGHEADDKEIQRKKERKEKSLSRSQRWPNTLEAQRKKKEMARQLREDKLEAERKKIDREEDERRARERLEVIKKANSILANQTDRMKTLKSQKLLVDVMKVRQEVH